MADAMNHSSALAPSSQNTSPAGRSLWLRADLSTMGPTTSVTAVLQEAVVQVIQFSLVFILKDKVFLYIKDWWIIQFKRLSWSFRFPFSFSAVDELLALGLAYTTYIFFNYKPFWYTVSLLYFSHCCEVKMCLLFSLVGFSHGPIVHLTMDIFNILHIRREAWQHRNSRRV